MSIKNKKGCTPRVAILMNIMIKLTPALTHLFCHCSQKIVSGYQLPMYVARPLLFTQQ